MSGRAQIWLDRSLIELLRVAAPHEGTGKLWASGDLTKVIENLPHTPETLMDQIVREWFQREDKAKYAELLRMRNAAREAADRDWANSLASNRTEP